jgi:energy-coupling factor transporter ATP-binding protein EcfA2
MLQKIFPRISAAHGHDKVLIIGRTGSGKSTLLNHLNGTVYRLMVNAESGKLSAVPSSGEPEIAETASSMHSKTIYPQVVKHKIKDYVYCDLAGLGDTHGDSYRICAASSVQILRGLAGGIKGVAIVLDLSSFLPRGELFRQTAVAFSKMVQHSHNLLDSVCFVVTHIAPHMLSTITPDGIIKDYVDNILDNYDDDEEGETEEEKALLFMLRAMKERKKQILISDITSGKFKEQLELFIGSLPVKHANEFTFLDHDHAQKDFNNVILRLMEYYLQLNTEFEQIPEMIAEKEERVLALKMSIGLIEHDKKRYEDLLDQTIKQQQQTDAILIQHPQNPYWQGQKADNAEMIKNQRARILELTALLANTDKDKSDCVESIVQLKHQQKQLQYELEESANLFTTVYVVSHLLDLQKEAVADFYAAYEAKHPKALDELGVFVKDSMRENKKTLSARQTWNLKNKQVLFNYEQKLEKGDDGPFSDLQYTDCEP